MSGDDYGKAIVVYVPLHPGVWVWPWCENSAWFVWKLRSYDVEMKQNISPESASLLHLLLSRRLMYERDKVKYLKQLSQPFAWWCLWWQW